MKILLRLKGGPRTTLPADINIFSLPFLYAPNKLFEIGKIQWQMPILPIQQHVARVSYTYTYTMYRPSQSYSYWADTWRNHPRPWVGVLLHAVSASSRHKLDRPDRAAGAALKLRATSHSCCVIRCVRPGRVLGLTGSHLRPKGRAGF